MQGRALTTYVLDVLAHARLRDPTTAKDLHGISRYVLRGARDIHFQQRNRPAERKSSVPL